MATINQFEDIQSWKKARDVCEILGDLIDQGRFKKNYRLIHQLEGSSGSIMDNIAEGFESGSDPEFVRFLKMARRSAGEVQSQLYLALDVDYITEDERKKTYDLAIEVKKLINGMMTYLRKTD